MERTTNRRPGITELSPGRLLVQVQLGGRRKTARVEGTMADAIREHARLVAELTGGVTPHPHSTTPSRASAGRPSCPTLREWLRGRCADHARVVQADTTRAVLESQVRALIFYLGDRRLDEIDNAAVNWLVERSKADGAVSFTLRKSGEPKRARGGELKNSAINKRLSRLRSALRLAYREGLLEREPHVELLPEDDSEAVMPPDDATLAKIMDEAASLRSVAPWFPEAIEMSIETGLRKGELFNLTWGSVDWDAGPNGEGALVIAEQTRGRLVGGKLWQPKNRRTRMVPLSPRARELLETIRGNSIPRATALVIPNSDGSPYERLQSAKKGSGVNTWRTLKEAMRHDVSWHDLRHLFAVRCLQANVPIATVSAWLGHSDINLTVKRYGRFAAESHAQWAMIARAGASARRTKSHRPARA